MVRRDLIDGGQVRDYADLRGLTIALAGQANAPEIELAKAAAIVIEPFAARIETMGTAVRWRGVSEIYGNQQVAAVVFGPALVDERPEVGRRWMVAYLRGLRDYNDAFGPKRQGRDAMAQALTKHTPIKDPRDYDLMRPAGLDPDGRLALQSIRDDLAYCERTGAVRERVDLAQLIDTSFQEYALRQLGPYQR